MCAYTTYRHTAWSIRRPWRIEYAFTVGLAALHARTPPPRMEGGAPRGCGGPNRARAWGAWVVMHSWLAYNARRTRSGAQRPPYRGGRRPSRRLRRRQGRRCARCVRVLGCAGSIRRCCVETRTHRRACRPWRHGAAPSARDAGGCAAWHHTPDSAARLCVCGLVRPHKPVAPTAPLYVRGVRSPPPPDDAIAGGRSMGRCSIRALLQFVRRASPDRTLDQESRKG